VIETDFRPLLIEPDDPPFLIALTFSVFLAAMLQVVVWSWQPVEVFAFEVSGCADLMVQLRELDERSPRDPVASDLAQGGGPHWIADSSESTLQDVLSAEDSFWEQMERLDDVGWSQEETLDRLGAVTDARDMETVQLTYRTGVGVDTENLGIGPLASARVGASQVSAAPMVKPRLALDYAALIGPLPTAPTAPMELLRRVLRGYRPQVAYCYERTLKRSPGVFGRIELKIRVEAGRATSVDILSDSTGAEELGACLVRRVKTWGFPGDLTTEFRYPFVFER
jgi:hypothetical protein